MADAERIMIHAALKKHNGNRTLAAEQLGISRRTLQRKLKEYRLAETAQTQPPPSSVC
jgi:transcriptional regulator with PAS, ATPase and Fis domain